MKKEVFCKVIKPDLYQMAICSGHKLLFTAGYTKDRKIAVKFDGVKMAASEARKIMIEKYNFYTFGNIPCEI